MAYKSKIKNSYVVYIFLNQKRLRSVVYNCPGFVKDSIVGTFYVKLLLFTLFESEHESNTPLLLSSKDIQCVILTFVFSATKRFLVAMVTYRIVST